MLPVKSWLVSLVISVLSLSPALAQSMIDAPQGRTLYATQNTFVFSAPPGGLISRTTPLGVVGTQADKSWAYFPLTSASGGNYTIGQPSPLSGAGMMVTGYRDVVQGRQVERWLQVRMTAGPLAQTDVWVLWGDVRVPNATLELR